MGLDTNSTELATIHTPDCSSLGPCYTTALFTLDDQSILPQGLPKQNETQGNEKTNPVLQVNELSTLTVKIFDDFFSYMILAELDH